MEESDDHRAVIERYLAAYNSYDVAGMLAVLHPEIVFRNVSAGVVTAEANGIDEFRALAEHAVTLFLSRRQTIREYHADGDIVRIGINYEGVLATHLGPGMRAGDTLHLTGRSTFTFRDGLIADLVDES